MFCRSLLVLGTKYENLHNSSARWYARPRLSIPTIFTFPTRWLRTILLEKQVASFRAHSDVWTTWPQSRVADGCGTSYSWWLCFGSSSLSGGFEGDPYLRPQLALETQLGSLCSLCSCTSLTNHIISSYSLFHDPELFFPLHIPDS